VNENCWGPVSHNVNLNDNTRGKGGGGKLHKRRWLPSYNLLIERLNVLTGRIVVFFKEIYLHRLYIQSVKDKLRNRSCNEFQ
jgi:hypothetical protein